LKLLKFAPIVFFTLTSCDAVLNLTYVVQNKTKDTVSIIAPTDSRYLSFNNKDSIFIVTPGSQLCVGQKQDIGFPWEMKKLNRANPTLWNFSIVYKGEKVPFNKNYKDWKYRRGVSLYRIKKVN
jgi:hypothetical protein